MLGMGRHTVSEGKGWTTGCFSALALGSPTERESSREVGETEASSVGGVQGGLRLPGPEERGAGCWSHSGGGEGTSELGAAEGT